jgi:predicted nucleic acid-binding protein
MEQAPKSTLIALDTNCLISLAEDGEGRWDALETIRRKIVGAVFIVPPTAIAELVALFDAPKNQEQEFLAGKAITSISAVWGFQPVNFIPVGHGIVESVAGKILDRGLLPAAERNDAFILAEAALLDCHLLLTADRHFELPPQKISQLNLLLRQCDVGCPIIVSPWKVVKLFSGKGFKFR